MALWVSTEQIKLSKNSTEGDLQAVIRAVYRQVLGNAHLAESERLTSAESQLRNGHFSLRDFVLAVGQSDLYRKKFFERSSQYRFIELNFKHFLGRAPLNQAEVSEHVQRYCDEGFDAEIRSYVESPEYGESFGENTVPYARSATTQIGVSNVTFNRSLALMRGFATTDASNKSSLVSELASGVSSRIVAPLSFKLPGLTGSSFSVGSFQSQASGYGTAQARKAQIMAHLAASTSSKIDLPFIPPAGGWLAAQPMCDDKTYSRRMEHVSRSLGKFYKSERTSSQIIDHLNMTTANKED